MRKLVVIAVVLLVSMAAITTTFGLLVLRPLPSIDADERLLGLDERVEILRDTYGVPHIFATDTHDLFFAQGYVTAQDRLWQMDVYRRAAEGKLVEVLGEPRPERSALLARLGRPDGDVGERRVQTDGPIARQDREAGRKARASRALTVGVRFCHASHGTSARAPRCRDNLLARGN